MSAKTLKYQRLYDQIQNLTNSVKSPISRMATIAAVLHHKMKGFFWTGFYLLEEGELLVGPYQGPLACLRLKKDIGVCWAGVNAQKIMLIDDVETFSGHIACSSLAKSEIVVPVLNKNMQIVGVLDVDSRDLANFDLEDQEGLEKIVTLIFE